MDKRTFTYISYERGHYLCTQVILKNVSTDSDGLTHNVSIFNQLQISHKPSQEEFDRLATVMDMMVFSRQINMSLTKREYETITVFTES